MDIATFETLLTLPLTIKELEDYGSWRGIYAEPALFFKKDSDFVPISELNNAFDDLMSGRIFEGYKGGEFSYEGADEIHFEYDYSNCADLNILELLSLDSIEYLRENNITVR